MKQWLSRFSASEKTLEFLDERIRNLRSQLSDPRSAPLTGMPRGGGDKADKIGRMLARVEELEFQRREQTEKSRHLYDEIEEAISRIQGKRSPEMQAILRMRHLDGADWETICEMLFGKRDDFLDRLDTFKRKMFQLYRDALDAVARGDNVDAITIVVDMNKKGFEKGCDELRGAINSLSKSASKMAGGLKSVIPSIIGVGSAFGILTKAASTFMAQNTMLTKQMEACWTALGNLIGQIVEQLVSWVVSAVSYLISFLNLLGVTSKTASQLSKQANKSTSDLQRTVAGFDELNVLQANQSATLPNLDPKEWMTGLSELLKSGQFAEAGRYLAKQLNDMVESVDWEGTGQKLAYGFKGVIDFLGNFIRDFDIHRLGEHVAEMFNQILHIDTSSEDTWKNLGEILVSKFTMVFDFLTGFLEELDTVALAGAVSGIIIGALEAISDSIANADWKKITENICDFFGNIDWEGIASEMWAAFTTAFSAASDLYEGLPDWLQSVTVGVLAVKTASEGLKLSKDFKELSKAIEKSKIGKVFNEVKENGKSLQEAMTSVFGVIV